jgi:large subunit ribosomal protein L13
MNTKTAFIKADEVDRTWWVVDAEDQVLGRLAARIAPVLMGKHRPTYTPNVDTGDFVIVINAAKVRLTGRKRAAKMYDWYTYHPGGRKVVPFERMIAKRPTRPMELAVRRMLPKGRLGRRMFTKLKVYPGPQHPHQAQQPRKL